MYKVTDTWTTRDGEWYPSNKPYSIDQAHVDKYANEDIPQKGAATHIIAKVSAGAHVQIVNRYNNQTVKDFTSLGIWFDYPMDGGASYVPERGETGPWNVAVDSIIVASGIGLPAKQHVSTFLVVEDVNEGQPPSTGEGPTEPTPPDQPGPSDGVWVTVSIGEELYGGWIKPIHQLVQPRG